MYNMVICLLLIASVVAAQTTIAPPDSAGEVKTAVVAGGWVPFAIVLVLSIAFSIFYVRYYQHRREKEAGPTVVSILALIVTILTTALIPVDIFLVSSFKDSDGTFHTWASHDVRDSILDIVTNGYYVMYGLICFFVFFAMPLAFFFFEEKDDVSGVTTKQRMCSALKFTLGTVIVLVVLMCIGAFALNTDGSQCANGDPQCRVNFAESSLTKNGGTNAISFTVGVLAVVGTMYFVLYTASGLAIVPLGMIKAPRKTTLLDEEKGTVEVRVRSARERQDALRTKYAGKKKSNMSDKDADDLAKHEEEERALLGAERDVANLKNTWFSKVANCCRPFTIIFGVLFLLFSIFIATCLLLTSIDRLREIESQGLNYKTGYSEAAPSMINPFDKLMDVLQQVFPLDYIVITLLCLYFIIATAGSIACHGIRFCFMQVFRVRAQGTSPQGLLCLISVLMFTILAINVELLSLTPQYSTYGNQVYPVLPTGRNFTTYPSPNTDLCDSTAPNSIFLAYNQSGTYQTALNFAYVNATNTCLPNTTVLDVVTGQVLVLAQMQCIAIDSCVSTRFSALLHAFFYNAWFFGAIYYWANWGFVLVFFISLIYYSVKKRSSLLEDRINEQKSNFDDDDDYKPFAANWMRQS